MQELIVGRRNFNKLNDVLVGKQGLSFKQQRKIYQCWSDQFLVLL